MTQFRLSRNRELENLGTGDTMLNLLQPFATPTAPVLFPEESLREVKTAIRDLVRAKDYPCVPAILSLENNQTLIGLYSDFGSGSSAPNLYRDLIGFRDFQKSSNLPYLSYWAVYMDEPMMSETEYETHMWQELSALSSAEDVSVPWDPNFSSNPEDPNFTISLGGDGFFIVGLHSQSSRKARRFKWPAMVFNLYEQFEELDRSGKYESTVEKNRSREMKYQGSLNPMVAKHGDKWEAIQFSGKENPDTWKCPFHRLFRGSSRPKAAAPFG